MQQKKNQKSFFAADFRQTYTYITLLPCIFSEELRKEREVLRSEVC